MLGRVVKGIGGFYYVDDGKRVYMGNARKNLKRGKSIIYVGDFVEFDLRQEDGDCIITKVGGRKKKKVLVLEKHGGHLFILGCIVCVRIY